MRKSWAIWSVNWVLLAMCLVLASFCHCTEVDWTRLKGQVKAINLKAQTLTLQNTDGDLITIPVDWQVKIVEKHGEIRDLKHLALDEKIIVTRTPMDKPKEDTEGLVPLESGQRGR